PRNRNVAVEVSIPPTVKPVLTDANRLKQVLMNLIDNALKFTEQGKVTVEVVVNPMDFQPIRIDVCDTGIGIPPGHLHEIFEPFLQIKTKENFPASGTGLGLSICRSLCDLLGHQLQVQSTPGKGSTFSVVLISDESVSLWEKAG